MTNNNLIEAINIENALVNPNVINYEDPNVKNHKENFEKVINEKYPALTTENESKKKNTSFVMRKCDYDWAMDILKGVKTLSDHNKKHHFKKKRYSIEANQLVRTITDPKTNKTETKRIAYLEQFFEIIYDIHCFKRFHQGIVKIYDQVCERYFGIPRDAVNIFRQFCYVCDLNKKQQSQPRLTPIETKQIFERTQLDLIDMRCSPDGEFNWIAHMVDHDSQLHALWAQKNKEGVFLFSLLFFFFFYSLSYFLFYIFY